ncbi:MAG: hypothetical protein C5B55_04840 [Blastocatellia bacterium]|nr:MAG: hypothetical protein C5B55_04840 [Blastocatellia bacterium]
MSVVQKLQELFKRKQTIEKEVNEELRFHIDMQTNEYAQMGISTETSREMAEQRFGDLDRIKKECVRIGSGASVLIQLLLSVFLLNLLVGLVLRLLVPESHVNRVGDVMMMIGGLGVLLLYIKQAGASRFRSDGGLKLDLNPGSPPVGFDESGRSPFDRVRSDD